MLKANKSNGSSKKTVGASLNSVCPKCGYVLREHSGRCPNCSHHFEDHAKGNVEVRKGSSVESRKVNNAESHKGSSEEDQKGGSAMDKQRSDNMSPSREYLNYLSNQLLEIESKRVALEKLYIPLKKEHDEINVLITSVKNQIKREEALNAISDIELTESSGSKKYKASVSYEEVEDDEDTAEEAD